MEQILIKKRKSYGAHLQQATSSSMLRHLVSELNNPASIRIQARLNVLLISAPPKLYRGGVGGVRLRLLRVLLQDDS